MYNPSFAPGLGPSTSADDARDAFLVELASFQLSLKKSLMVCEAEARQVEEYQKERERIGACACRCSILPGTEWVSAENERTLLKEQIEGLKTSLEQAQLQRRRKIEYDAIAEKINALPSREELEQYV